MVAVSGRPRCRRHMPARSGYGPETGGMCLVPDVASALTVPSEAVAVTGTDSLVDRRGLTPDGALPHLERTFRAACRWRERSRRSTALRVRAPCRRTGARGWNVSKSPDFAWRRSGRAHPRPEQGAGFSRPPPATDFAAGVPAVIRPHPPVRALIERRGRPRITTRARLVAIREVNRRAPRRRLQTRTNARAPVQVSTLRRDAGHA